MWEQDVQDREELELIYRYQDLQRGWVFLMKAQPLCYGLNIMQYCHAQALQKATVHPYRGFLRLKKEGASHELVPLFILPII